MCRRSEVLREGGAVAKSAVAKSVTEVEGEGKRVGMRGTGGVSLSALERRGLKMERRRMDFERVGGVASSL